MPLLVIFVIAFIVIAIIKFPLWLNLTLLGLAILLMILSIPRDVMFFAGPVLMYLGIIVIVGTGLGFLVVHYW